MNCELFTTFVGKKIREGLPACRWLPCVEREESPGNIGQSAS